MCSLQEDVNTATGREEVTEFYGTHSSAGSAAAAAAAFSPGGGCSAGTAFEDLAGVDVGDTLFVGDPWKRTQKIPILKWRIRLGVMNGDWARCAAHLGWRPERETDEKESFLKVKKCPQLCRKRCIKCDHEEFISKAVHLLSNGFQYSRFFQIINLTLEMNSCTNSHRMSGCDEKHTGSHITSMGTFPRRCSNVCIHMKIIFIL